jgi:trk system potassium uptake protein TrkA
LAKHHDPVLVIGLGRFGSSLALELTRSGVEVLAVDHDPDLVQRFAGRLERVVAADTTDPDALAELGAADFMRVVVAIGADQQASILTASLLADLGVPNIWAKALSPQHARILERVGANHVISPEHDMGQRVAHLVSGSLLDYVEIEDGWVMARAKPPKDLVGKELGATRLRTDRRVTVVGVKPAGSDRFTHAESSTVLAYGDDILVMGAPADVERFADA